jgi:hypothetical protein
MFGIWLAAATDGALLGYATSYRLRVMKIAAGVRLTARSSE